MRDGKTSETSSAGLVPELKRWPLRTLQGEGWVWLGLSVYCTRFTYVGACSQWALGGRLRNPTGILVGICGAMPVGIGGCSLGRGMTSGHWPQRSPFAAVIKRSCSNAGLPCRRLRRGSQRIWKNHGHRDWLEAWRDCECRIHLAEFEQHCWSEAVHDEAFAPEPLDAFENSPSFGRAAGAGQRVCLGDDGQIEIEVAGGLQLFPRVELHARRGHCMRGSSRHTAPVPHDREPAAPLSRPAPHSLLPGLPDEVPTQDEPAARERTDPARLRP